MKQGNHRGLSAHTGFNKSRKYSEIEKLCPLNLCGHDYSAALGIGVRCRKLRFWSYRTHVNVPTVWNIMAVIRKMLLFRLHNRHGRSHSDHSQNVKDQPLRLS